MWMDRTGKVLSSLGDPDGFADSEISPDGRRLATSRIGQSEAAADIWTLDLETGARKRITTAAKARFPVWSHDGQRIAYQGLTGVAGNNNVYEVGADGATPPKLVVGGRGNLWPVGWLADERFVFANEASSAPGGTFPQGFLIHEPDHEKAMPYRVGGAEPSEARLSPDAKRIVFAEIGFGGSDLFVDQIPSSGAQPVRVRHGQSQSARWSADGREVFFVSGNHLMAATISDGPVLKVAAPTTLFDVPSASFAVDPKTGRFLVMRPVSTPVPSVTVTLNWSR
jgi:Tol biopolymer transport system component